MRRPSPSLVPVIAVVLALASGAVASACGSFGAGPTTGPPEGDGGSDEAAKVDGAPGPGCDPAQTATDAHHCGACGHDCLGGACAGGKCQPLVVGRTKGRVLDLAVNASHVVWMSSDEEFAAAALYACPKAGCVGAPLLVKDRGVSGTLAGDGTKAYATFAFVPDFFEIAGPVAKHIELPASHRAVQRLQVRPEAVYSLAYYEPALSDGGPSNDRRVYAWDGKAESLVGTYTGPNVNVTSFVVVKDRLYLNAANADELYTCPTASCTSFTTLKIADAYTIGGIQTDDTRLYWMSSDGRLRTCVAGATCDPTVLGSLTNGRALAVGPETLFFGTADGDLRSCDPADCNTTKLVFHDPGFTESAQVPPNAIGRVIAYDATAVYWAAMDEADARGVWRIMKLAR